MNTMMAGLLLAGLFAGEMMVTAVGDHIAQALVRPSIGDAVMIGPPIAHPEEPDYRGISETELLRLAAGYDGGPKRP